MNSHTCGGRYAVSYNKLSALRTIKDVQGDWRLAHRQWSPKHPLGVG